MSSRALGIGRALCPGKGRYFPFKEMMMSIVPTVIRRFGIKLADGRTWDVLTMDVRGGGVVLCVGPYAGLVGLD